MRNALPFLRRSMASVLAQEGVEVELLVIDDGSSDGSIECAQAMSHPRLRLLRGAAPQGTGPAATVNRGLEAASGEFIARCDADDLLPAGRLAWQAGWLRDHPEFGAVCGAVATMSRRGRVLADLNLDRPAGEITGELCAGGVRTHMGTYLIRTPLLRRVGGCRAWFRIAEDTDLQLRLGEAARVWFEPRRAYLYRLHDASVTHAEGRDRRAFYDRAALEFQRQRLARGQDDLQAGRPPPPPQWSSPPSGSAEQAMGHLIGAAWKAHGAGRRGRALATALRACLARPASHRAWRTLGALLLRPAPRQEAR
jgi:glycosyltransferase involved in cell wall biosynthesis